MKRGRTKIYNAKEKKQRHLEACKKYWQKIKDKPEVKERKKFNALINYYKNKGGK